MALIHTHEPDQPGTHVLVIGVSRYPYFIGGATPSANGAGFEMGQLQSAARSAADVAAWLLERKYLAPLPPLASLRILLSPSPGESVDAEIEARLSASGEDYSATRANVERELNRFYRDCHLHRDNHAIVYVAGHGVQLNTFGAQLLLEDAGHPDFVNKLHAALDLQGVHKAFRNAKAPRHQFWFVDVCRQEPRVMHKFEELVGGLKLDQAKTGAAESSPMFLSAVTGTQAYALAAGRSLFCDALMWALQRGGAATAARDGIGDWHVRVSGLSESIPARVRLLARAHQVDQMVEVTGMSNPAVFHVYDQAPTARLQIDLDPADASTVSASTLRDENDNVLHQERTDWPVTVDLPAGLYRVEIRSQAPYKPHTKWIPLNPPELLYRARLA